MSYILDALRRADAERERDPGRGIHAQPVALPAETGRRIPWWIVAVAAALALLVAGALLLRPAPRISLDLGMPPPNAPLSKAPPAAPAATPVAAQVIPPAPPPAATEVSPPAPTPVAAEVSPPAPERSPERPLERAVVKAPVAPAAVAPAAPPAAATARATMPAAPARAATAAAMPATTASKAPATPAAAAPTAAKAPATTAAAAPTAAATPATTAAAPTAAAASAERILAPSELPPEVQRELPKLHISGGVHSDNPAQRMLIVGGQVITEGAEAAPGVLVEQIRPKSAVLKFRGWRYSVQY